MTAEHATPEERENVAESRDEQIDAAGVMGDMMVPPEDGSVRVKIVRPVEGEPLIDVGVQSELMTIRAMLEQGEAEEVAREILDAVESA